MPRRFAITIAVLGLSLSACSMIGARPTSSPGPSSSAAPSPMPSATAPATSSPSATNPPSATNASNEPGGLNGREFVSVLVTENGKSKVLVAGTKIRLGFSNGMLSASAGCNSMGGDYQLNDNKLVTGSMATTEMGCPTNLMDQDQWLATFLGSKPQVALDGNNLVLTSDATEITFLDREKAEPDQPLTGITWGLTTIIDGETASSVPTGASATLLFRDDGTVQIDFGCNAGGGNYSVDADTLHLAQIVSTDMACLGAKGDVEAAVTAVLNADDIKFSIDHSTLTLTAGQHGLQYDAALDVTN